MNTQAGEYRPTGNSSLRRSSIFTTSNQTGTTYRIPYRIPCPSEATIWHCTALLEGMAEDKHVALPLADKFVEQHNAKRTEWIVTVTLIHKSHPVPSRWKLHLTSQEWRLASCCLYILGIWNYHAARDIYPKIYQNYGSYFDRLLQPFMCIFGMASVFHLPCKFM